MFLKRFHQPEIQTFFYSLFFYFNSMSIYSRLNYVMVIYHFKSIIKLTYLNLFIKQRCEIQTI